MSKRILVLTDASQEIGLGHAMRQLSLAQYFKKNGLDVNWVSASTEVHDIAQKNGICHFMFPSLECAFNDIDGNAELVVDIHQRDLSRLHPASNLSKTITLVSDIGYDYPIFGKHIVLVGSDLDVWSKVDTKTLLDRNVLLHSGRKWMIFRDEFSETKRPIRKNSKNILVCHGGSDPHNLTELTLNALDIAEIDITITVLATDRFPSLSRIKKLATQNSHPCDLVLNSCSVRSYMEVADLAIINGGNVRYELCLVGTPYIAISFQPSQYKCTHQLSKIGVGVNLGLASHLNTELIAESISQLYANQARKTNMSEKMKQLFDLQGAERILGLLA